MATEAHKGRREVEVFLQFLQISRLPIDPTSVEKRDPPEPDIFCTHRQRGDLAFELVELCDPSLARLLKEPQVQGLWTSDPSVAILGKKLNKNYRTPHPIELLCYTDGRIITPDDVLIPTVRPLLARWNGVFRRTWLLGETGAYLLWGSDE